MSPLRLAANRALLFIFVFGSSGLDGQTNVVQNPGFEQSTQQVPNSWIIDNRTQGGSASLGGVGAHSGNNALALSWTPAAGDTTLNASLGAGQALTGVSLLGKTLYVSGWLSATSNATAVLTALAYRGDGNAYFIQMRQGASSSPVNVKDKLAIPNDPRVMFVVLLCQLEGVGSAYFDDLSVTLSQPADWNTSTKPGGVTGPTSGLSTQVNVNAGQIVRAVPPTLYGQNLEWIWGGNGAWDLVNNQPNPRLVQMTQDMGVKVLRFPGGLFADFYDWRNAVGPIESRPLAMSIPGDAPQKPFFGADEAQRFASSAGAELMITVNVGTGTAQMASDWVRHMNQGARKVRYWEIGNELYAKGGALFDSITMTPTAYAQKVVEYSRAMKTVDPGIKIGAIVCETTSTLDCLTYPGWTETVLRMAGDDIDFLAVHNSYAPGVDGDLTVTTTDVYKAMLAAPLAIRRSLDALSRKIAVYAPARSGQIKIAVTEWGPYFSSSGYSRFVEHVKTTGSAVYAASVLKVFAESNATESSNAFQLVDGLFTGWIGKRNEAYVPKAPYYVLRLFAQNFKDTIVATTTTSPTFDTRSVGNVPALSAVPYVEAIAGKSANGRTLKIALWNKHLTSSIAVSCTIQNFQAAATATAWTLQGEAPDSHTGTQPLPGAITVTQAVMEGNSAFNSGTTSTVAMPTGTVALSGGAITVSVPPASIILLTVPSL